MVEKTVSADPFEGGDPVSAIGMKDNEALEAKRILVNHAQDLCIATNLKTGVQITGPCEQLVPALIDRGGIGFPGNAEPNSINGLSPGSISQFDSGTNSYGQKGGDTYAPDRGTDEFQEPNADTAKTLNKAPNKKLEKGN